MEPQCLCGIQYGNINGICKVCHGSQDPFYGILEGRAKKIIEHDKGLAKNTVLLLKDWFRLHGHTSMANGLTELLQHEEKQKELERILLD